MLSHHVLLCNIAELRLSVRSANCLRNNKIVTVGDLIQKSEIDLLRLPNFVFGGAVSKDTVSRVWRKVKGDWDAWNARSFAEEPIIRLILDGTVRVRKATAIVLLVRSLPRARIEQPT
jgi:hypothetical protein